MWTPVNCPLSQHQRSALSLYGFFSGMHVEMELPCLLLDLIAFTPVLSPWMPFGGLSIF